jgi:hypothetical protein
MRTIGTLCLALAGAGLLATAPAQAQDATGCYLARGTMEDAANRPSPLGAVVITLGGEEAKLCYGRPSARGRTVMGDLVPMGTPWRTGANEATALHLPFSADVGGIELEPGVYSLYTIPGESEWKIVLNRAHERWGIPINDEVQAQDVGSFERSPEATEETVETLTFRWEPHGEGMGHLIMEWEHTRVEIPIHKAG